MIQSIRAVFSFSAISESSRKFLVKHSNGKFFKRPQVIIIPLSRRKLDRVCYMAGLAE